MARRKTTFIRLCRAEFEALTAEERRAYLADMLDEAQQQITGNRKVLERHQQHFKRWQRPPA